MMAASLVIAAAGTVVQVTANKNAADYQAKVAENNATIADLNASAAAQAGSIEEENHRAKVRGMLGTQRSVLAANNLVLSEGTPLDLMVETAATGEADAQMLRFNAMRQAWGYREEGKGYRSAGEFGKVAARNQNVGTIISGLSSMAGTVSAGYGTAWGKPKPAPKPSYVGTGPE